jgi:hypothetical protein
MKPLPHDKFKKMFEGFVREGYLEEDKNGEYVVTEKSMKNLLENLKAKAETKGLESMSPIDRNLYMTLEDARRKKEDRSVV